MQNASNRTSLFKGRYFICLSCLLVTLSLLESVNDPTLARTRTSRTTTRKKVRTPGKPAKAKATESSADTSKQYFQDISNLERAYALYDRGLNEYIVGDFGLSADHLSAAAQIFSATYGQNLPQQETFFYDLALAQEGAGNLDGSIESYNKSLSHGGFFDGYLGLAQLYGRMGNWSDGAVTCRRALDLRPDDPRANLIYGLILEKQGRLADAAKFKAKAKDFVSTFGLSGVKNTADKDSTVPERQVTNPAEDNLPGVGAKDLELP
ncbi:MAG: tetratricopeptide repeat protein [Candidatus Obscuribacterales bacterium]|nr:tetratricopeptide repeat protein [Candidatus Obscuribacterales bacterium]